MHSQYVSDKFSFSDSIIIPNIIQDHAIRPGDVVIEQYTLDGKEKWHAAIITKVTEDMIYYTANSKTRINEPLTTMWNSGKNHTIHVLPLDNY